MPVRTWLALAAAAAFALAAVWLATLYLGARTEADLLRDQNALTEIALQTAQQQLEAERILTRQQIAQADLANTNVALLASAANDALAVALWNPAKQEGVLVWEKTPALRPDERYELWISEAKPDAQPVSVGVLDAPSGAATRIVFKPRNNVASVGAFAVSREKNDGVRYHDKPGKIVMSGPTR